jgi:hypothetical protein
MIFLIFKESVNDILDSVILIKIMLTKSNQKTP